MLKAMRFRITLSSIKHKCISVNDVISLSRKHETFKGNVPPQFVDRIEDCVRVALASASLASVNLVGQANRTRRSHKSMYCSLIILTFTEIH